MHEQYEERRKEHPMTPQDSIEREITVTAPLQRVWELVAQPGWWIGDGDPTAQRRWSEGGTEFVEDPKYGLFPLRVEGLEPPRYAAFRWTERYAAGSAGADPQDAAPAEHIPDAVGKSTLVECWLGELPDGTTWVRVLESGFAALTTGRPQQDVVQEHSDGWRQQLDILRTRAEHVGA